MVCLFKLVFKSVRNYFVKTSFYVHSYSLTKLHILDGINALYYIVDIYNYNVYDVYLRYTNVAIARVVAT